MYILLNLLFTKRIKNQLTSFNQRKIQNKKIHFNHASNKRTIITNQNIYIQYNI